MEKKKLIIGLVGGIGVAALLATTISTCCLYSEVKRLRGAGEAHVAECELTPTAEPERTSDEEARSDKPAEEEPLSEMKILNVEYSGQDNLTLSLSEEPDLDVLRQYVTVEPLESGVPSFSYRSWKPDARAPRVHRLTIAADFMHRTNVTLRVRKGFPITASVPEGTDPAAYALKEPFSYSFRRKDKEDRVGFADKGRYLPASEQPVLALSSVNISTINASIRDVPPANIVPILSLEEGEFEHINKWGGNDMFIGELSGEPTLEKVATDHSPNKEVKTPLALKRGKGIFLVGLRNAKYGEWTPDGDYGGTACRLVCVSDYGLSVRRTAKGLLVWVTSLTEGAPVKDVVIEAYSTANVLVAKGVTDADGLCTCEKVADGEPFAVVASAADGSDRTFLALRDSMALEEDEQAANRQAYLSDKESTAFAWTERGIYRHREPILFHAILRDGTGGAPKPFPVQVTLTGPRGVTAGCETIMPDAEGSFTYEGFSVDENLPSGKWKITVGVPIKDQVKILGSREFTVEEFAPPQIRVKAHAARKVRPQEFSFTVSAEHLYGGPAKSLVCGGAILFDDVAFAPPAWKGWSFGSDDRALKPTFRELDESRLDDQGRHLFAAPLLAESGKPKAAVRVTVQGTVFEDGGRPATVRDSVIAHYYPYYIGAKLPTWMIRPPTGLPKVSVACVNPDGTRVETSKKLVAKLEILESVYSYRRNDSGWTAWNADRVRRTVAEKIAIETKADGDVDIELPSRQCGDYVLTIEDPIEGVAFAKSFYLSDWGDERVQAPLSNPTAVTIKTDKDFYRPGESPRLIVKSPFTGTALLTILRNEVISAEVFALTNATSEITLRPCEASWAPNVEARLSVVQQVTAGGNRLAARAHGAATIVVRRPENEIDVTLKVTPLPAQNDSGSSFKVDVSAPGATHALVTLTDEGIHLLTDEETPDPIHYFATPRICGDRCFGFFDLYHRLLPVYGKDDLRRTGVKTGGGFGADMLGRVSPVPTRRFKPLSLWQKDVPVVEGKAEVSFVLPEFVGEVRVTAVAHSERATGAASVQQKVCPNLVMEPDAPRFVAPGDRFRVTLPLANRRTDEDGDTTVRYRVSDGSGTVIGEGEVSLAKGDSTVVRLEARAPEILGEMLLTYEAEGLGERHRRTIDLPVRPAVPWEVRSGVERLEPGASWTAPEGVLRHETSVSGSQMSDLVASLTFLANYPHGCLEQTSSRIFPLLAADGLLSRFSPVKEEERAAYVKAGVNRVESMIRPNGFVMWPDCSYEPWDVEVSLYAAHFLVEAERSGVRMSDGSRNRINTFLRRWSLSSTNAVSAYACHTLALADRPDKDRMLRLYDDRKTLDLLSRARLARAFVVLADRTRAERLLENASSPTSVCEAAFTVLALLDLDPDDARLPALVKYIQEKRGNEFYSWGTTGENAHALLALAAYYRAHPVPEGDPKTEKTARGVANTGDVPAFVAWRTLSLPRLEEVKEESAALSISRSYLTSKGEPYDLDKASAGDLVIVRLTLTSDSSRDYNDLVIEDMLPGAFEPVRAPMSPSAYPWFRANDHAWVMRSDARDDRMFVFSKKFHLEKDDKVTFCYPIRVVSPGTYALPPVAVEAMYQPAVHACSGAGRLVVRD